MKHEAFRTLPIVDVSELDGDANARQRVARELGHAAREAGFLYVTGHGIERALSDRLLAQAKAFFALSSAEKMAYFIGHSRHHRGYVPPGEEVFYGGGQDLKEAFDLALDLPDSDPATRDNPLLGPNVWPDLPNFQRDVGAYYERAFALGKRLFRAFASALGLPEAHFDPIVTKPPSQLRLIHYPKGPEQDAPLGIAAHTDYECFTMLLPTAPGLEVMNGAGEWIDAPPHGDALVVNIGDMLEILSNGAFVATSHRVRPVSEERYAFPLFFACDYDTIVQPIAQLLNGAPPAYRAISAGEHLFAQTAQSFRYLQARIARGELSFPKDARPLASFGPAARRGVAES